MKRQEFLRVSPEEVGISSSAIKQFIENLANSETEMHGIQIMRRGKICAEGWWTPYAPGLRHGLQSLTKTYAATAVGLAYTEGLLKLSEPVIAIFPKEAPEQPGENLRNLTVRDVLCMGCGMDEMPRPSENWIRDFLAVPVLHKPGTAFMYNSMGSTLLGAMVRKRSGLTLHEYLTARLFDKIGIDADNFRWLTMSDGTEIGGGGGFATTEDNLRLMKLYADGGVWEGERLLAADYVQLATSKQNDSATEAKVNPPAFDNFLGYGFQIWMCKSEGCYRADGAMGQFSIVCPPKDLIIAINETAEGAVNTQRTLDLVWELIDSIDNVEKLPPNEKDSRELQRYLNCLSLPHPPYHPWSPYRKRIHGVRYIIKEGNISFRAGSMAFMSGKPLEEKVTDFTIAFSGAGCTFAFTENGTPQSLYAALDGNRFENRVGGEGAVINQAYLSGAWVKENVFTLKVRWVETCFEKEISFFIRDDLSIQAESKTTVGSFMGFDDTVKAIASPV